MGACTCKCIRGWLPWRTWLLIAYSNERWLYLPILTTSHIHFSFKGWGNVLFELGSERVNVFPVSCWTESLERRVLPAGERASQQNDKRTIIVAVSVVVSTMVLIICLALVLISQRRYSACLTVFTGLTGLTALTALTDLTGSTAFAGLTGSTALQLAQPICC